MDPEVLEDDANSIIPPISEKQFNGKDNDGFEGNVQVGVRCAWS
jgi:hypothetical protein